MRWDKLKCLLLIPLPLRRIQEKQGFDRKGIQLWLGEQIVECSEIVQIQALFGAVDVVFPQKADFTSRINHPAETQIDGKGIERSIVLAVTQRI